MKRIIKAVYILFLIFLAFSCQKTNDSVKKGPIVVASKIDTEGGLLGQMIVKVLEYNKFEVVDNTSLGATKINREAIINGETDIYPDYTGNGAFFLESDYSEDTWKKSSTAYDAVKKLDYDKNRIVWLKPAPANNTWAISVTKKLSDSNSLKTLNDLAKYLGNGGEFKIACSEEFVSSPAALPSFEKAYGFKLSNENLLVLAGGNTAQTEQAAARGTDGVNAAMAYGTDGQLAALGLIVLEDTKGIQPVYEPAALVREEILNKYPEIKKILEPVFSSLNLVTLQTLNGRISVDGESSSDVAVSYLKEKGFIK